MGGGRGLIDVTHNKRQDKNVNGIWTEIIKCEKKINWQCVALLLCMAVTTMYKMYVHSYNTHPHIHTRSSNTNPFRKILNPMCIFIHMNNKHTFTVHSVRWRPPNIVAEFLVFFCVCLLCLNVTQWTKLPMTIHQQPLVKSKWSICEEMECQRWSVK